MEYEVRNSVDALNSGVEFDEIA